jgi:hypothetical protein
MYQLIQLRSEMIMLMAYVTTVAMERMLNEEVWRILSYRPISRFLVKILTETIFAACMAYNLFLKMEAVRFSKISQKFYQTACRHIPENSTSHSPSREN